MFNMFRMFGPHAARGHGIPAILRISPSGDGPEFTAATAERAAFGIARFNPLGDVYTLARDY